MSESQTSDNAGPEKRNRHRQSFWREFLDAGFAFSEDDCSFRAAGIAFFAGLSLLPTLLMAIAALGAFFDVSHIGRDAEEAVLETTASHFSPALQQQAQEILREVHSSPGFSGQLSAAIFMLSSLIGFVYLDRAFDRIGGAHIQEQQEAQESPLEMLRRFATRRLRAFLILLSLMLLFLVSATVDFVFEALLDRIPTRFEESPWFSQSHVRLGLGFVVPLVTNLLAVTLLYRLVPTRRLRWQPAFAGAVLVTLLWEIGRKALAVWLSNRGLESAYGLAGAFLILQLWIYYASLTLLYGAEFAYGVERRWGLTKTSS